MRPDLVFRKSPDIVARGLTEGKGGVLLNLESGAYFSVNAVALAIWELIDGQRTVADLIAGLRERVADGPPELDRDVTVFLDRALERKLIVAESGAL